MSGRGAIAQRIQDANLGLTIAVNIWLGGIPPSTKVFPAVSVSMWGGNVIQSYGKAEQQPNAQVYLVGEQDLDDEAEALANQIWQVLADTYRYEADGTNIEAVIAMTSPMPLGVDNNNRPMYSFNLEVTYA